MSPQRAVLVTGASRGLGAAFCRQYASEGWQVFAACRSLPRSGAMAETGVTVVQMDVADPASIARCAVRLADAPLDLLVNNAGVMGDADAGPLQAEPSDWEAAFRINVLAPALVTRAFLPNLSAAPKPVAATMGSQAGIFRFITDARMAAYRATKAAAHAVTLSLAAELAPMGIPYVSLRPGPTRTDMLKGGGQYEIDDTVARLRRVLAGVTPAQTGLFLDRDGSTFPYDAP